MIIRNNFITNSKIEMGLGFGYLLLPELVYHELIQIRLVLYLQPAVLQLTELVSGILQERKFLLLRQQVLVQKVAFIAVFFYKELGGVRALFLILPHVVVHQLRVFPLPENIFFLLPKIVFFLLFIKRPFGQLTLIQQGFLKRVVFHIVS
jgi:hypothetical protein